MIDDKLREIIEDVMHSCLGGEVHDGIPQEELNNALTQIKALYKEEMNETDLCSRCNRLVKERIGYDRR